jgi:anaerobic magnesium-protoporphyrin IX monomethyl ester cyclase
MDMLPALRWPAETVARHGHHHHRFEAPPAGPGAEVEASRGCPYHCTFCAKDNFRDDYRRRPLAVVLEEIDALAGQGVEYHLLHRRDLPAQPAAARGPGGAAREVRGADPHRPVGPPMLELLGRAGCVSIEAGVESITEEGRALLDKKCRLSTAEMADRLVYARRHVPFVQANLLGMKEDDPAAVEAWREHLQSQGVWANKPVPLFAYPGSPEYTLRWGDPDDQAWERAHRDYLRAHREFSDIQEQAPQPLVQLETKPW